MKNLCKISVNLIVALSICGCSVKTSDSPSQPLVSQNPTFQIINNGTIARQGVEMGETLVFENEPSVEIDTPLRVEPKKDKVKKASTTVADVTAFILQFTATTLVLTLEVLELIYDIKHWHK